MEIEKSRGLKKATNVGKARYGGPPNKEHIEDTKHSGEKTHNTAEKRKKTQWRKGRRHSGEKARYGDLPNKMVSV